MVTIEELERKIKEIDKDRRILQLELENLKLRSMFPPTITITSTPRAWDP